MFKIFLVISLISCSSIERNNSSVIAFDKEKVLSWHEAQKNSATRGREVLYRFKNKQYELYYLAASHGTSSKSKTFNAINWVFENTDIKSAIVEGFANSLGWNSQSVYENLSKGIKDDFYPNGEISLMVVKAKEHRVPYIGGEPDQDYVLSKLIDKGYTEKDYLSFLFIRALPQRIRSGEVLKRSGESIFNEYIGWKKKIFNSDIVFTYSDFKAWYLQKQKKEFNIKFIENGEAASLANGRFYTNKIALVATKLRDEKIVDVLADVLNKYKKVFIAYGSSHYRIQYDAIKEVLGEPEIIYIDK